MLAAIMTHGGYIRRLTEVADVSGDRGMVLRRRTLKHFLGSQQTPTITETFVEKYKDSREKSYLLFLIPNHCVVELIL